MTDPEFHIENPRLYISYLLADDPAHCELLVRLYNAPHFVAALSGIVEPIPTPAAARERIATRFVAEHAKYGYGQYLVSLKPQPQPQPQPHSQSQPEPFGLATGNLNVDVDVDVELESDRPPASDSDDAGRFQEKLARCKLIGTVSLLRRDRYYGGHAVPDVGFAILPEETRKGYAREAALAVMEYARRERGVGVVIGLFHPKNEASRAVFRSLGFEDRGVRKLVERDGEENEVWVTPGAAEDLSVYNL